MNLGKYGTAVKWALLLLLTCGAVYYAYNHPELFSALKEVSVVALLGLGGVILVSRFFQALMLRALCRPLGAPVNFVESFGLVMCNSMYSLLAPGRAGLGVQAWYLKSTHDLSLARFGAVVVASNLLQFVAASFVGVSACLVGLAVGMEVPLVLLVTFSSLLCIFIGGTAVALLLLRLGGNLIPWDFLRSMCVRIDDGLRTLWGNKGLLSKVAVLCFGKVSAGIIALVLACRAIGLQIGAIPGSSMAPLAQMSVLLPVTPGGLGVAEGALAAAGHAWRLPADAVMLAALVRRAVGVSLTFTGGILFSYVLLGGLGLQWDTQGAGGEDPDQ